MMENLLNIVVVCRFAKLRTKTNAVLVSLAVVELISGVVTLLRSVLSCYLTVNTLCTFMAVVMFILLTSSVSHLICVTLDRYLAIIYPLHYHVYFPIGCLLGSTIDDWNHFIFCCK